MTSITLTLNGRTFSTDVVPRTQLAELLRERALLTGTHLGCEHGICGACTVLVDGVPVRSCITYAVACNGAEVTTIEGLDNDPLTIALRSAFRAHHALQCGFCTPGMLITARDIVGRLSDVDIPRIRLELAGNLCRCTGYAGVVSAIHEVAAAHKEKTVSICGTRLGPAGARPASSSTQHKAADVTSVPLESHPSAPVDALVSPQHVLLRSLNINAPIDTVWAQFADIAALAGCLPGAEFGALDADGVMHGWLRIKFGPITAAFEASARHIVDAAQKSGTLVGQGRDRRTGTKVSAEISYALCSAGSDVTEIAIEVRYGLSGTLAQFARGALAERFADRLTAEFAANLAALLQGKTPATASSLVGDLRLLWAALLQALRKRFS